MADKLRIALQEQEENICELETAVYHDCKIATIFGSEHHQNSLSTNF